MQWPARYATSMSTCLSCCSAMMAYTIFITIDFGTLQCHHIVVHTHMPGKVTTGMIAAAHGPLLPNCLRKDSVASVHCMTDTFVVQVAPNPNGQGDGLGPSAAPAPPIPPCTKEPWLCPTVHNPYYNYFSNLRCGRSFILSVSLTSPYIDIF